MVLTIRGKGNARMGAVQAWGARYSNFECEIFVVVLLNLRRMRARRCSRPSAARRTVTRRCYHHHRRRRDTTFAVCGVTPHSRSASLARQRPDCLLAARIDGTPYSKTECFPSYTFDIQIVPSNVCMR